MLKPKWVVVTVLVWTAQLWAQQSAPQVRINYLNPCAPAEAEQKEMAAALARVPVKPAFAADFEVARGRSSIADLQFENAAPTGASDWVRIRREFPPNAHFSNVQYSFSVDEKSIVETLVLRVRDPKDVLQIAIQDTVSAASGAAAVLAADTPPNRIKIERFGKPGVALARCQGAEQASYEPVFRTAAQIMSAYRAALAVRRTVPGDLARLKPGGSAKKK